MRGQEELDRKLEERSEPLAKRIAGQPFGEPGVGLNTKAAGPTQEHVAGHERALRFDPERRLVRVAADPGLDSAGKGRAGPYGSAGTPSSSTSEAGE